MRIEQTQLFLNSLMRKGRSGQVAPAAFQRPYVSSRADVVSLCQSIVAGYPIGGFLSRAPHKDVTLDVAARPRLGAIVLETQQDPRNV